MINFSKDSFVINAKLAIVQATTCQLKCFVVNTQYVLIVLVNVFYQQSNALTANK